MCLFSPQLFTDGKNKPIPPMTVAMTPPIISQTVRSVGAPVKKRDTSELKELLAENPQIKNTTPTTTKAVDIAFGMAHPPRRTTFPVCGSWLHELYRQKTRPSRHETAT